MKSRILYAGTIPLLIIFTLHIVYTAGAQTSLDTSSQDEDIPVVSNVVDMAQGKFSPDSPFYNGPEQPAGSQEEHAIKMQEATADEQQFVNDAAENKIE